MGWGVRGICRNVATTMFDVVWGGGGAPGRVDGAKAARLGGKEAVFGADAVSHVIEEEDVRACLFRNSLRRWVVLSDAEELVRAASG